MITASLVTKIFLTLLVLKGLVESYLEHRNKSHILANAGEVPEKFKDAISLEEHQNAANYTTTKINVSQFFNLIEYAILLIWTVGGGFESLYQLVSNTFNIDNNILLGVTFFLSFAFISTLLSLPQSIYSTFVIEEKFGFNKMTPKLFTIDLVKGLFLGLIIGTPILYAILWIMSALGSYWWVYAWAFLTIVQLVLLWAYPTFIAPLFNKFSPMEEGETKERVLKLLDKTGFFSKGLFVMDASIRSSHGNAYFTGFGKNKRIVFFDTLINKLSAGEVEAVLAHELGHFKKKHILKSLVKSTMFSLLGFYILGALISSQAFYEGHGVMTMNNATALILFMSVSGIYTFFLTPINAYFSRKNEFEADEFAATHSDSNSLITALVKLYKENASTLTPDPVYSNFYHSHPPALTRVEFLESLSKPS